MRACLLAVTVASVATWSPSRAQAGACPICDGPQDCPGGFCVLHDSDVGCGADLMLCCPGQGCAIDGATGRPSCEAAGTCTVIEAAADAAPPDSTPGAPDATPGGGGGGDGCGCRAGARGSRPAWALAPALFALSWLARRSRKQPR